MNNGPPPATSKCLEDNVESQVWHSMDVAAVSQALDSLPDRGLSPDEVDKRLREHGPNELTQEEKASAWEMFFAQFKNILIIILIVATILSAVVGE
jgi:Ca2+-transporting ATPase